MDAATLLLLTSTVGVGFGWQPMPDDSPRVEYLVQIEPEMLTALQAGAAIPIVSEVPENIGPIGRIRIVIGRGTLPRQGLAKPQWSLADPQEAIRHKPNSAAPRPEPSEALAALDQSATTTVRGQFTPSVALPHDYSKSKYVQPRYQRQPGAGPPRNGMVPTSTNGTVPTSTAAPSAASANAGPPGAGVSSTGTTSPPPLPPQQTPALASPGTPPGGNTFQKAIEAGERQAAAARAAAAKSVSNQSAEISSQWNKQLQQATNQIPEGLQSQPPLNVMNTNGAAAGGPSATLQVPHDPSTMPGTPSRTNSPAPANSAPGTVGSVAFPGPPTASGQRATPGSWNSNPYRSAGAVGGENSQGAPRSVQSAPPSDASLGVGPTAANQKTANQKTGEGGPGESNSHEVAPNDTKADSIAELGDPRTTVSLRSAPVDDKLPAHGQSRPHVSHLPKAPVEASGPPTPNPTHAGPPPAVRPHINSSQGDSAQGGLAGNAKTPTAKTPTASQTGSGFMLLLAWVLLVGSVAGNLYLFWSYLSIRSKYHAMIRSNRRSQLPYSNAA